MSQKTSMTVLALDLEDPSSSAGVISVARKLVPYLPTLPNNKKQKTLVHGDQGFFERGLCIFFELLGLGNFNFRGYYLPALWKIILTPPSEG